MIQQKTTAAVLPRRSIFILIQNYFALNKQGRSVYHLAVRVKAVVALGCKVICLVGGNVEHAVNIVFAVDLLKKYVTDFFYSLSSP